MQLRQFLPYRLAVLAEVVSRSMAAVYGEHFELSRDEWRLLAALAENGAMKAAAAAQHATLDKMQASRALRRLESRGLVAREVHEADRRHVLVRLLPAGRAIVRQIVPKVLARERYLVDALSAEEAETLDRLLTKLTDRARELARQP